jgi:endonuclease/exonuclease/phosphatase family metal-dependent hydrolase
MGKLTVATFNIWGLNEPWRYMAERGIVRGAVPGSPAVTKRSRTAVWPRRRRLLVQALEEADPDVIGLQEVRSGPAVDDTSQAAQIAHDLAYTQVFLPTAEEGDEGLGMLSRHQIVDTYVIQLPWQDALHAVIACPQGVMDLIVCHLTPRSEEAQIMAAGVIQDYLEGLPQGRTVVVVGDLNAEPDSQTVQLLTAPHASSAHPRPLRNAWRVANPSVAGPTMPSEAPTSQIDYILVGDGAEVLHAERLGMQPDRDGFYPSDHLGVVATLRVSATDNRSKPHRRCAANAMS